MNETKQNIGEFEALVHEIAKELGYGVTWHHDLAIIEHKIGDDTRFFIERDKPDRLRISGSYPRDIKGECPVYYSYFRNGKDLPEITVKASRGAKAIANEIKKRFLPDYQTLLARCLEANEQTRAYYQQQYDTLETIGKVIGRKPEQTYDHNWILNTYKTIKGLEEIRPRSNNEVELRLEITTDMAIQVLELLKNNGGKIK